MRFAIPPSLRTNHSLSIPLSIAVSRVLAGWLLALASLSPLSAAEPPAETESNDVASTAELERGLKEKIGPFLNRYCLDCHSTEVQEAKLDLSIYDSLTAVETHHQTWQEVLHRIETGEMPPADSEQPEAAEAAAVTGWITRVRRAAALRNAGDPGPVLTRRLSNAEYDYSIHDLTGFELRPTRDFPVDPANEAGFDNSGESLAMSPALLQKYLTAAREVAEHLVLKLDGFDFAPHPVVTATDRDKYAVKRIIEFYQRQPVDLADYFFAAWKWQHNAGGDTGSLEAIAAQAEISPRYLAVVAALLTESPESPESPQPTDADLSQPGSQLAGPLASLRHMWSELPDDSEAAWRGCQQMRDEVRRLRRRLEPSIENLQLKGGHLGSQPFVLWKNDQYAAARRQFIPETIADITPGSDAAEAFPELVAPDDLGRRAEFEASLRRFCDTFPDAFFVSERGRDYVGKSRDQQEKGRLLSAGFHSMMGYYRDDAPLYDLILSDADRREIDTLWQELDFVTSAPMRQYSGFVWFERTDSSYLRDEVFDFARAEDKSVTSEPMIERLAEAYAAKARRNGGSDEVLGAIETYFQDMNARVRWVERARQDAEPSHLEALLRFASKAFRRPLAAVEQEDLLGFYRSLRENDELEHEEAIQDCIVAVLMSPQFCYRVDLAPIDDHRRPLTDLELASRLSYFLWSGIPDDELMAVAEAGRLSDPDQLEAQVMRMLTDRRAERLATEFVGNWLDFRRFEQHNSVDRERYPEFNDDLRRAMFQEPIRFFVDLLERDASVLELVNGRHTFVNDVLAKHYGVEGLDFPATAGGEAWRRVDDADRFHRGGLLPMAVFQTVNSPGLRTSPVKRGYWVARRVLGERIPPPPPNVPELPADEHDLGALTLAETLAKHREHESCAVCHDRFDSLGLVFENYGPVGQWRSLDLAQRSVDSRADFPDGTQGEGLGGLRDYLARSRQADFVDNLTRKLLSYAIGRNLLLSDEPLVESLQAQLAADDYQISSLFRNIVSSSQFLEKRGRHD